MQYSFKKGKGLSIHNVRKLLKTAKRLRNTRNYMLIYICVNLGLRSCELLALRRCHVEDVDDNVVHVPTAKQRKGGKGKNKPVEYDSIVVVDKVAAAIQDYVDSLPDDQDWLFALSPNNQMSRMTAYRVFHRIAEEAGVALDDGISLHALRHTQARYIYERTKDIYEVKTYLRHRSLSSSMAYMGTLEDEEHQRSRAKRMIVFE